jgi:hypothetical protein
MPNAELTTRLASPANGAIALIGEALGGATFVSFDKRVVVMLERRGQAARLLA